MTEVEYSPPDLQLDETTSKKAGFNEDLKSRVSNEGSSLFEGLEMSERTNTTVTTALSHDDDSSTPSLTPASPTTVVGNGCSTKDNQEGDVIQEEEAFDVQDVVVAESASLSISCPQIKKRYSRSLSLPIPNSSALVRLLTKFISKASKHLPSSPDSVGEVGFLKFFFSNQPIGPSSDPCLGVYYKLCALINDSADAREMLTTFTSLISAWAQPTDDGKNQFLIPSYLLSLAINTAEALVAHSCFDNVYISHEGGPLKAVGVLTEAILQVDLSSEETELSLLQFLLTTGCHTTSTNEAMVRGTNLLQTIRVCYHIYLKTASEPNKTTARAALQQLVTSVFQRMQNTSVFTVERKSMYKEVHDLFFVKSEMFLSSNHRDAFLVLRSLCKLSMKSLPDESEEMENNVGFDSKILALELLLYVLEHTDGAAYLNAGTHFLFAIRNYLCVSLLTNCTSNLTQVVGLSLRLFVPLIKHFKSHLKTEIEAFVTNVFFVILDSNNSTLEHKTLVVTLFQQICADKNTLAEIFLNYDCDMSAVDLFDRIVNALAKVARTEDEESVGILNGGHRIILSRQQGIRKLKLEAMMAIRQILAGLHASTVVDVVDLPASGGGFVAMYDTKKKLKTEQTEVILRFNQKPSHGLAYAGKCGHLDIDDPNDVARFLLEYKDKLEKTQVGEYLGREVQYQDGFCLQVLHHYIEKLNFSNLMFDDAIRYYLSGFRLPGEAQKIDRIMEKFAERYCLQNTDVFPTADVAFILAFSIIMLNTDLHNPAIKEDRRMTKVSFIRNNRGICDGGDLPDELLNAIFDRIQNEPISLKEDDKARERVEGIGNNSTGLYSAVFPSSHFYEIEKGREYAFLKERDHIVRTTECVLKRNKAGKKETTKKSKREKKFVRVDTALRDQYVKPMFDVTWGPALAVYSYAMEATKRELSWDMTDEEADSVEEYGNVNLDICLVSFRLAICTSGLCGNFTARDAFVHALYNFTQLGTSRLLDHRNIRCLLLLLKLGREDGELLGNTWEYIFKALSIVARLRSVHDTMIRNDRGLSEEVHSVATNSLESEFEDDSSMSEDEDLIEEEMDRRTIDEANARTICDVIPEGHFDTIYAKSTSLSSSASKEFILQLCRVSRMEISGYGGHVGSRANEVDLTDVHYRQQHTLSSTDRSVHQPVIFSLQKLVEVTHYNMDSRSRLVFADIWTAVAGHLTSTALHSNAAVAMYAVDSFRQLAIQFLQREELGMFEFQKRFLKQFETVMSRCKYVSIKELLLNCVEQIILIFGNIFVKDNSFRKKKEKYRGALRSGWKPVLAVLGLAGQDSEDSIVTTGFKLLNAQVVQALHSQDALHHAPKNVQVSCILLSEHFVDLVESLVMFFGAKIETISLMAIEHIIALTDWLVDESIALPVSRRRAPIQSENNELVGGKKSQELELWWPILLGLSRSMGDNRRAVREKSLQTLLDLIHSNFLSPVPSSPDEESLHYDNELQTLQLIFRGVLTSTLEHAETDVSSSMITVQPSLPDDFSYFITHPPPPFSKRSTEVLEVLVNDADASEGYTWLDTTFDKLMDACVSICLRSMEVHQKDSLVEEILAMLNSCLLSENAALAVRGLMRLQQFITVDIKLEDVSDNTWAVVCHMLRRCLTIRGLSPVTAAMERISSEQDTSVPLPPNIEVGSSSVVAAGLLQQRSEDLNAIQAFVVEEDFFSVRRFVASAAVRVIGDLLSDENFSKAMGMRWLLFLMTGLGHAIQDWESASTVMNFHKKIKEEENNVVVEIPTSISAQTTSPPHYLENALYGRKRMVNLILLLVQKDDVLKNVGIGDMSSAQNLLKEQTESIIQSYLDKEVGLSPDKEVGVISSELSSSQHPAEYCRAGELSHFTSLVCELLEGYKLL